MHAGLEGPTACSLYSPAWTRGTPLPVDEAACTLTIPHNHDNGNMACYPCIGLCCPGYGPPVLSQVWATGVVPGMGHQCCPGYGPLVLSRVWATSVVPGMGHQCCPRYGPPVLSQVWATSVVPGMGHQCVIDTRVHYTYTYRHGLTLRDLY